MEDGFDFNEFMEDNSDGFNPKLEQWRETIMAELIEQNYKQIEKKGIDPTHLKDMTSNEIGALQETLEAMLEHYEGLEEFEKCALIKKELDKVTEAVNIDI
jgi:hypothetical protein